VLGFDAHPMYFDTETAWSPTAVELKTIADLG
jgi:hypothetical protein